MAKQAVATRTTDLEPIDRLEEKVKLLISVITQLRSEQAKLAEDNTRLVQELDALRARLADAENVGSELNALRDERDIIRARVAEMLQQLDTI